MTFRVGAPSSYNHLEKFGDHKHHDMGDLLVLICYLASSNHVLKGSCDILGGSPSW